VPRLVELSHEKGYRIFILGGKETHIAAGVRKLRDRFPNAVFCGAFSPPFAPLEEMDHAEMLRRIHAARPDILFVAFGNPKQEKWIWRHRRELRVPCCIGIGGSIDFIAGATARAPAWMCDAGLEWLFRLVQEPRRLWRRYLWDLAAFGTMAARQLLASRGLGTISRRQRLVSATLDGRLVVSVTGRLDRRDLPAFKRLANDAFDQGVSLVLDLNRARYLDDQVLGALVNLQKRALWARCEVVLVGPTARIRGLLRSSCLLSTFRLYDTLADALQTRVTNPLDETHAPDRPWEVAPRPAPVAGGVN